MLDSGRLFACSFDYGVLSGNVLELAFFLHTKARTLGRSCLRIHDGLLRIAN